MPSKWRVKLPPLFRSEWRCKVNFRIKRRIMKNKEEISSDERELAREVREACVDAAREGFKDASMRGLCAEGAMEAAIGAIEKLDLERFIHKSNTDR